MNSFNSSQFFLLLPVHSFYSLLFFTFLLTNINFARVASLTVCSVFKLILFSLVLPVNFSINVNKRGIPFQQFCNKLHYHAYLQCYNQYHLLKKAKFAPPMKFYKTNQQTMICSKSTTDALEKYVKYVQS